MRVPTNTGTTYEMSYFHFTFTPFVIPDLKYQLTRSQNSEPDQLS